jgi:hypothetical protein
MFWLMFNNSIFRIRPISYRDRCEDRRSVRRTYYLLANYTHIFFRLDGYLEVIGDVQPTPVAAVLAYTMQHTKQINSWKRNKKSVMVVQNLIKSNVCNVEERVQ